MTETNNQVLAEVARIFWAENDLRFKLKQFQMKMWQDLEDSPHFKYVIKCCRRFGKTFFLCTYATEVCEKKERAMVRYAAPTNKSLKKFILPVMHKVLEDCPPEKRPVFLKADGMYQFPNGSEIHLAGVNNDNADSLRGTHADLFIIDEAGYADDLEYVINDIALPQFLDPDGAVVEGRKLIISSSPPRTPAHPFTSVAREAEFKGAYAHYDIYDADYPKHVIDMIIEECGGVSSTTWKREYLALDVVDENFALIPEWKDEYVQTVETDEFFPFYHKYVSLDIGVRDLTVALFGHYDFLKATLYIHKEVVLSGPQMTTERLASEIREAESKIFLQGKVHKRISDIDLLLLNDLRALHQLYFAPTDKGKLEEMVNEVRIWVSNARVIVDPSCKQTVGCLAYGVWNEHRTDFERIPQYGHFDALASLMYLIRNIDQVTNPIPVTYGKNAADTWFEEELLRHKKHASLRKAFGVK